MLFETYNTSNHLYDTIELNIGWNITVIVHNLNGSFKLPLLCPHYKSTREGNCTSS